MDRRRFLTGTAGVLGVSYYCGKDLAQANTATIPENIENFTHLKLHHSSRKSLSNQDRTSRKVCIVGGGIAGLSAALELAERNYKVTVLEAAPILGGKLHTRKEFRAGQEFAVEHGLHMWFFQYYNFQNTLERLGVWEKNFRDFKEVYFEFKPPYKPQIIRSEGPYPLNMLGILRDSENLNILNAAGTLGAMKDVIFYDHSTVYERFDHLTFEQWLNQTRVDKRFREVILEPAASVTLNDPQKISAAEMIMYQHLYFLGHPRAFHRKITTSDHGTAVIEPWAQRLRDLGVSIQTDVRVTGLQFGGEDSTRVTGVMTQNGLEPYDEVILASDVPGLKQIVMGSIASHAQAQTCLDALKEKLGTMGVAPQYSVLRVWFDQPISPNRPYVQSVVESSQYRPINLVSITSMFEAEAQEWAVRTGGSIVEFHLYNTPQFATLSEEEIWREIEETALELLPELKAAGARPIDFSLGRFKNFTSLEAGQGLNRPHSSYPRSLGIQNLALAGDCIQTTYPSALMERALATGREAASLVLQVDNIDAVALKVPSMRGPGLVPRSRSSHASEFTQQVR